MVDLTGSYYNSSPQVKASLIRLRGLIDAVSVDDRPEPVTQLSQLALAPRNGTHAQFATALTSTSWNGS